MLLKIGCQNIIPISLMSHKRSINMYNSSC